MAVLISDSQRPGLITAGLGVFAAVSKAHPRTLATQRSNLLARI